MVRIGKSWRNLFQMKKKKGIKKGKENEISEREQR